MNFLLDENVPPSLAERLRDAGIEASHLFELGLGNSPDEVILQYALENGMVVLTYDSDFTTLLALGKAIGPSVLYMRTSQVSSQLIFKLVQDGFETIKPYLLKGAVVVIDDNSIRIRELPI